MSNRLRTDAIVVNATDSSLETLLAATAVGDEKAFGCLYAETNTRIFAVIPRIVARWDLAEEILQEVFLTIWDRAADYRPDKGAPMAWLTTIGRNRALDRYRRTRREVPLDAIEGSEHWVDSAPSPLDWAMVSADSRRLKRCLESLGEEQRRCILMASIEGYTIQRIVDVLRRPRWTESMSFWRWCAAGASTVAATLALYIALWPVPSVRHRKIALSPS